MTFEDFLNACTIAEPEGGWSPETLSLWYDKKGDWDRAHSIAQEIPTAFGSAIHAYLHREEGVLWNADYWYGRAGRGRPAVSLEEEWASLAREALD
jgi:hypothetical protein